MNASFTWDLTIQSVRFWIVFLTEHKVFDILSVLVDTHRTRVCRYLVADQLYPLFGFSLTKCRYFHILSTYYEPVWQILGLKELTCKQKYCLTLFIHKTICCLRRNLPFLCSVIFQGQVVAQDRWGGKWNHLSMTHRLTTNSAKNYCNRTIIVKDIVENVGTCFF